MKQPEATTSFDKAPRYKSFLLTVWAETTSEAAAQAANWRFSLEDPHTGERRGYAGLDALLAALQQIMADLEAEKASDAEND